MEANALKWLLAILVGFAFGAGGVCLLPGPHALKDYIVMGIVTVMPTLGALKTNLEKQLGVTIAPPGEGQTQTTTVTTEQQK